MALDSCPAVSGDESQNADGKAATPRIRVLLGFNPERLGSKEVQISLLDELNRSQPRNVVELGDRLVRDQELLGQF